MYRFQLWLEEAQHEFLEEQSREQDTSKSAVLRELIDAAIQASRQGPVEQDPLWTMVGAGKSSDKR
jgi:hypothetical protein